MRRNIFFVCKEPEEKKQSKTINDSRNELS
jgi:hypothetical protein